MTGFASFLGAVRGDPEDRPGALQRALHAPEPRDPEPRDPDEIAACLMARGYPAGHVSDLAQRLAEKSAELAGEREKIERGEKVTARVRELLSRGQIGAMEAHQRVDADFGDVRRAEQLQRQCANLQRQVDEAAAMISPRPEAPDQFAQVNRTAQTAHELFAATTRQRMADAQAGKPQRARRPKELSRSRGADAVRTENCIWCIQAGVDDETAFLLHSDPERPLAVTPPGTVPQAEQARQVRALEAEQAQREGRARLTGHETTRTTHDAIVSVR